MKLLNKISVEDKNLLNYEDALVALTKEIPDYKNPKAFMQVPFDEAFLKDALKLREEMVTEDLKYIVVVGIGGSNLGTRAIYDALFGFFDSIEPDRFPKILFLETTNPQQLSKITDFLESIKHPAQVIINVISKSGKTLETVSNMEVLLGNVPYAKDRLVITTMENSPLHEEAERMKVRTLTIPSGVGGRYSVFTSVGLFPLACTKVNLPKLLEGAMKASHNNIAQQTAYFIYQMYKKGKDIHDLFVFEPELESLGQWYEQLMAESLGKDGKGITPTTSVGSVDLHSEAQLDVGGPKDKMFTFVWSDYAKIEKFKNDQKAGNVKRAILESAMKMFRNHEIPIMEIEFDGINELEIGEFMQTKMIEVALLGKLMGVNPFNQPNVEEYKVEAKKILGK